MAIGVITPESSKPAGVPGVDSAPRHYVARQPILDARNRIHGYELLFRSDERNAAHSGSDAATQTVIDNIVVFGLPKLTGGQLAFLNCTAETLIRSDIEVLPSNLTVIEVLESVDPNPDVIQACRRLKNAGFRLALDDFVYSPPWDPLVRLADYIKIDFRSCSKLERQRLLSRLGEFRGALLAEKVETPAEYDEARREGFAFFQGFYFCKPDLLTKPKVPANRLMHLNLLKLLGQSPLDVKSVSELVKREPSLTYRLLRLVNSSAFGQQREIDSIPAALITVGDDIFRRIATLAVAAEMNAGPSTEILRMALLRARFCELASEHLPFPSSDLYLLGLFSMLPAMLQMPMEQALQGLSLAESVRGALLGSGAPIRAPLAWLECYERGEWRPSEAMPPAMALDDGALPALFMEAARWADETMCADCAASK